MSKEKYPLWTSLRRKGLAKRERISVLNLGGKGAPVAGRSPTQAGKARTDRRV